MEMIMEKICYASMYLHISIDVILNFWERDLKIMNIWSIEKKGLASLAEMFVTIFNAEPWRENWTKGWALECLSKIFNSNEFYVLMAEAERIPVGAIYSRVWSYMGELEREIVENFVNSANQLTVRVRR